MLQLSRTALFLLDRAFALAMLLPYLAHAGGYVPPNGTLLNQATSIQVSSASTTTVTFNNATLTNQNTIAETNNNLVKTPSTADPVSTVTGNNYHDETDFVIKGRAGLNYAFTRTYNSAPSATQADLGLGYGWVHSYGMRLKSNDYGSCPNCTPAQDSVNGNGKTGSITYTDERGGDHNYLVNELTYAVTPPQGEFDSLALDAPSAGQYTLTFRNGTKYVFQSASGASLKTTPNLTARLIQIADPWGNQLNFSYDTTAWPGHLTGVVDNLGTTGRTGLVFSYDANGHLKSIADWAGRTWQYSVDGSSNLLMSYTNPLSKTITYGYAAGTHNLTTVAKPLRGVRTAFTYYQNGRTFNDYDALGNAETLDYDLYRKSTRVTDPRGGIRDYEYDLSGRLTKLTEPDGAILQFQNQSDGLRYSKTDGLGYLTQYSYKSDKSFNTASDNYGNVTREQDPLGYKVDTTYGPYDQMASVTDKRGTVITTSFYSGSGTCVAAGKPNAVTISTLSGIANVKLKSYCWNSDGTLASQTDYLSPTDTNKTRVTSYTYDTSADLNVQSVTVAGSDGTSVTKTYTYDNLGRKHTETLARRTSPSNAALVNLTLTTNYDALDRVVQVQDAIGDLFINNYDDNGQLWRVTHQYKKSDGSFDVRNIVTRTFDAADRVLTETDALGGVTTYAYDNAGNVIAVTDPEKHTLRYQYDAMNRRTAVTDANGRTIKTTYDLAGHPIQVTNGNNETASTTYDADGRPLTVTDPHGYVSQFSYDPNDNRTCVIDANAQATPSLKNSDGCTQSTQYDELNRPVLVRDALNGVTQTSYDLKGNPLIRVDAEGRQYTWAYDGLGRLVGETDFSGKNTSYALDEAGNVWQKTNRLAEITQTTYDNLNRPTLVSYLKDGTTETLGYDPAGNLNWANNGIIGYTFAYDGLNRLLSKLDSRGVSLNFTWDKSGHLLTKTTYQGSTTHYTYDGAGTLVSVSNPDYLSLNYQYDDAGRLVSRVMSSGARSLYTYDAGGWLNGLTHYDPVGATVLSQSYTRDRVGNITAINVATGPNAGTTSYTLDALYRLTVVDAPGTAYDEAFSYDRVGNRLIATRGSTTAGAAGSGITSRFSVYAPASQTGNPGYPATYNNRLQEIHLGSLSGPLDSSFGYDDEGRLTGQTGSTPRTLGWDAKGRLHTLAQGGVTQYFNYDPSDHRISRSGGPIGNLSYFLEGEHLEWATGSTYQEKYFRGSSIDELVAGYLTQSGQTTPIFFQHDPVMSVAAETKPNGGTQATFAYWAFGETQTTTGTPVGRLKYTGREDDGTGFYYYRARYYDPSLGRFISEDPKGFGAGENFYAYVGNNPINANDPSGLDPISTIVKLGGRLGNALTRAHVKDIAQEWIDKGWKLISGGGALPEKLIPGPGGGAKGGAYGDIVLENPATGQQKIINTIDTYADGITPTTREASAGQRIQALRPDAEFVMIPKPKPGQVAAGAAAGLGAGSAQASDGGILGSGITWGDVGDFLIDLVTPGGVGEAGKGSDIVPGAQSSYGGAAGGFLLYPNKPNTNQLRSVYSK